MRRWLPILAVLAGLGGIVSVCQPSRSTDPFDRYNAGVRKNVPEVSLLKFASSCGADLAQVKPKFAESGGDAWIPVKHLGSGESGLATDFWSTVEVWARGPTMLVETWDINGSDGGETRTFRCFKGKTLTQLEAISWSIPEEVSPGVSAWGFEQFWKRDASGKMQRIKTRFVNKLEGAIPRSNVHVGDKEVLGWKPDLGDIDQLKLPASFLK